MSGQYYQGHYGPTTNQRMPSGSPNGIGGHMGHQMHNSSNMMSNSNGMNPSMTMNGPIANNMMNKANMQHMNGWVPQNGMYPGPNAGPNGRTTASPRARPYPNPQQYVAQKRQYNMGGAGIQQQYNSGPVGMQSQVGYGSGPGSQSTYNSNQVCVIKISESAGLQFLISFPVFESRYAIRERTRYAATVQLSYASTRNAK